jgi:serine/threonine-protein kinase
VDIYSAGVILWEAATQRRMWKGAGDLTVLQRVAGGDIPLPSSVQPQVPKRLEEMCMKALAVRREDRYPSAAALQAEIEDFLLEIGSRVSARQVGALTAKTFADEQTHLKVLIEDQLRMVRDHPDPQSIVPIVTLIEGTGSMTSPGSASYPPFAPRSSRRKVVVTVGGALALLVGLLLLWSSRSSEADDALSASTNAVTATSASLAPPEPTPPPVVTPDLNHVKLTLEMVPTHARVSIDDTFLPPNSHRVEVAKDAVVHKIRAEALGYRGKTEWVRFDSDDIAVKISLDPMTSSRKGHKEPGREGTAPPMAGESSIAPPGVVLPPASVSPAIREIEGAPARRHAPAPPLDTSDPWKK